MEFTRFIEPELLVLIPVLYLFGVGLKKSKLKNKYIPLLLGGFSVLLSLTWVLATNALPTVQDVASAVFTAVTQGVLLAGASVYANQIYTQAKKDE